MGAEICEPLKDHQNLGGCVHDPFWGWSPSLGAGKSRICQRSELAELVGLLFPESVREAGIVLSIHLVLPTR